MYITEYHTDRLKKSVSVRDVFALYIPENKINEKGFALCPFHTEKTPSLAVHADRYHCFGCGESGDIITLTSKLFGLSFKNAVLKLNRDFCVGLPLENMSLGDLIESAEQCRKAAEERKREAARLENLKKLDMEFLSIYHDELERLLKNKAAYKPKPEDKALDERYAEAVSEIPRIGALFDEWWELVKRLTCSASEEVLERLNGILSQFRGELALSVKGGAPHG